MRARVHEIRVWKEYSRIVSHNTRALYYNIKSQSVRAGYRNLHYIRAKIITAGAGSVCYTNVYIGVDIDDIINNGGNKYPAGRGVGDDSERDR